MKIKKFLLISISILSGITQMYAQTTENIINILLQKKIISQREADSFATKSTQNKQ